MSNNEPNVVDSLELPRYAAHSTHPFRHQKNHDDLVEYLAKRLDKGKTVRDGRLPRMARVDKQVAGFQKLSEDDQERAKEKAATGAQIPVAANIPLTLMHLDDLTSYYVSVFVPITGAYNLTGDFSQMKAGKAVVKIMNQHAQYGGLVMEANKLFMSGLKYNLAGQFTNWHSEVGSVLKKSGDSVDSERKIVWEGNRVESLDMYNTLWDPAADPLTLYKTGEFCTMVKKHTRYEIQRDTLNGVYRNTHALFDETRKDVDVYERKYYIHPPTYVGLNSGANAAGEDQNWGAFFGAESSVDMVGVEIAHTYIWLNPYEHGLKAIPPKTKKRMLATERSLYRIGLMSGKTIIEAVEINAVHQWLPFTFIMPNQDEMGQDQKSIGEIIDPFQVFVSFLYNVHTAGSRASLFGTTYYDPNSIDMDAVPRGEVAARIPMKAAARGKDIRSMVYNVTGGDVNTDATMTSVDRTMSLLNDLIPTQASPAQVAGVDRAIKSQMHTLNQATSRRTQKSARVFDAQGFQPSRVMQFYNILQYHKDAIKVEGETITKESLLELGLEFIIGHGLKAIDQEITADKLKDVMFMILQNQEASKTFDLPALLTYLLELTEVKADLNQFKRTEPEAETGGENADESGGEPATEGDTTTAAP